MQENNRGKEMTPEGLKRLDELHANTTRGAWYAEPSFAEFAYENWPAISAELTRLREFEAAVREAFGAQRDFGITMRIDAAIDDLDRKRGEKASEAEGTTE
jgi:hypothetical protein